MTDQPEKNVTAEKYQWSKMTALKFGRYAEHLVCMELLGWNFNIYTVDVDDHGIDLIGHRPGGTFYEFQIKASRKFNYIFFPKVASQPKDTLFGVIVPFIEGKARACVTFSRGEVYARDGQQKDEEALAVWER